MRHIGVLMSLSENDRESGVRLATFLQALQDLGWVKDRNLQIELRWGADDIELTRRHVADLIALAPEVILASGSSAATPLQKTTRSVPIVFVQVAEPQPLVANFARPGGNVTGFASIEPGMSARWLPLLKEIAPGVTRAVFIRDANSGAGNSQYSAVAVAAPALGVEISPVGIGDASEIERGVAAFAGAPNGGLIVTTSTRASAYRDLIIALAARHRLPAVYPFRLYAAAGGLISYGPDYIDQYRRAAGYVDRILRGEKPADLPVQTPTKYETLINLKTAKALGLDIPRAVLARADEVIE